MACEIIGAKMLAPYFGTSLYVWAAALGITLGGLMVGYFLGGIVSRRVPDNLRILYIILIAAAAFLFLMPFTSPWIMNAAIGMSLQWGAVLSLTTFMFPPLVFMGMVSPLIINLLTREVKAAGNSAGNVYAISTFGGILATFLMGFYIIPEFGISRPAMIGGFLLGILPAISLLRSRRNVIGIAALVVMAVLVWVRPAQALDGETYTTLYHSEGILGQVRVLEFKSPLPNRKRRGLVVNNTLQTIFDINDPSWDYWPYTRALQSFAAAYPPGSKALLLGMGGGTVVRRLDAIGLELDIVELDHRIRDVAIDYFNLFPAFNIYIDDARHFVRVSKKTYDIIIYDVFKGEEAPVHVLTQEGLREAQSVLAPDGLVMINFYGYLDGDLGLLTRSIVKTLKHTGFECRLFATPGDPDHRNILLTAWLEGSSPPIEKTVYQDRLGSEPFYRPDPLPMPALEDAVVLTDERPQLQIFARAAMQWRRLFSDYFMRLK